MPRSTCLLVTAIVANLAASTGHAQDYAAAGRHFNAARAEFSKGRYGAAADEFRACYEITKDPVLLYNLGEAYEKQGKVAEAKSEYQRYLAAAPTASDRADVEKRIASLGQREKLDSAGKSFRVAQQAYAAGRYGKAVEAFHSCYELTRDPVILYNLAEAHEHAGNESDAVRYYQRYLAEVPKASDRALVEKRIAALQEKDKNKFAEKEWVPPPLPIRAPPAPRAPHAEQAAATANASSAEKKKEPAAATVAIAPPASAPVASIAASTPVAPTSAAPTSAPPTSASATSAAAPVVVAGDNAVVAPSFADAPPPVAVTPPAPAPEAALPAPVALVDQDHPSRLRLAAWIGVATTVVLLTAGAIFGLAAQERADEISRQEITNDSSGQPRAFDATLEQTISDLRSQGRTYNAVGIGLMAASGATAVASGLLFWLDYRAHRREQRVHLVPSLTPGGGGLAASLEF